MSNLKVADICYFWPPQKQPYQPQIHCMKVSLITTCYNRAASIRGSIESVLGQDYPDIEYIVVDGASSDGTLDIINQYKDKISTIISEPDNGMYEAINKGLRAATGDIIGLVHSDDWLFSPSVISHVVECFNNTGADFLYGDGIFVKPDDNNSVVRKWLGGTYRLWKVKHGWLPLHPTCYIKRDILSRKGFYNETYKIAADSDFLLRLLLPGDLNVAYLQENIIKMRMGGLSTNSEKRRQMWREDERIYNSHGLSPRLSKIEKVLWKLPQYVRAKF